MDFEILKYNLYEIIDLPSDASLSKIKINLNKLIKSFHPDKNSKIEIDIYYHILYAKQILLDENLKIKYDSFIYNHNKYNNYIDLKMNFTKDINTFLIKKDINTFFSLSSDLDKKHGYDSTTNEPVVEKFNEIKEIRNHDIIINKTNYNSSNEFNKQFIKDKCSNEQHRIIEYKDLPLGLSTHVYGKVYTNLEDIDKLYINDSIEDTNFTSLDQAFLLHP